MSKDGEDTGIAPRGAWDC